MTCWYNTLLLVMIYWFFLLKLKSVLFSIIYYSLHTLKKCNHHFVLFFSNIWMISVLKLFQCHFETFLNLFPKFESLDQTFVSLQLSSILKAFYAPVLLPLLMLSNRFYNRRRDKQVHCLKWLLTSYNRFLLFLKGCPDEEWHQIQIKVCQFWLFTNKQTPHSKIRYLHMLKCYMYIYFCLIYCVYFFNVK